MKQILPYINTHMVQTSAGTARNEWIVFMRVCAEEYKKRKTLASCQGATHDIKQLAQQIALQTLTHQQSAQQNPNQNSIETAYAQDSSPEPNEQA